MRLAYANINIPTLSRRELVSTSTHIMHYTFAILKSIALRLSINDNAHAMRKPSPAQPIQSKRRGNTPHTLTHKEQRENKKITHNRRLPRYRITHPALQHRRTPLQRLVPRNDLPEALSSLDGRPLALNAARAPNQPLPTPPVAPALLPHILDAVVTPHADALHAAQLREAPRAHANAKYRAPGRDAREADVGFLDEVFQVHAVQRCDEGAGAEAEGED